MELIMVITMKNSVADPELMNSIGRFLLEYLPNVRRRDEDTIVSYRKSIDIYFKFLEITKGIEFGQVKSSDFTQSNIVSFMEWLKEERGNSEPTINHRLSDIKNFCKYFMKKDVLSSIELQSILDIRQMVDTRDTEFIWLTAEQVKLVIDSVSETRNHVRDRFFLSLMYESGCRIDEILSLKIKDLSPTSKGDVNIHFLGKGGKHRITPLSNMLWKQAQVYISQYHKEKDNDSYLFYVMRKGNKEKMSADNVQRILSYCEKRVKEQDPSLPHLHAHLFRRTRAMHLYEGGLSLPMISEWLGHAQLETTQIYARLSGEMKKKALEAMQEKDNDFSLILKVFTPKTQICYAASAV